MNSLPIPTSNGTVSGTTAKFTTRAAHRQRSANRSTGAYSAVKNRDTGFVDSGRSLLTADTDRHQHGHERDRQERGRNHRERFRERERPEHPPFLRLEQEHRGERHDDDRQREENSAADLFRSSHGDLRLLVIRNHRPSSCRLRQMTMSVLHHHDRRVDQDADRQRNPAQRHDVGAHAEGIHGNECGDNGNRQARIGTSAERRWNRKIRITIETTIASSISVRRSVASDSPISPERS